MCVQLHAFLTSVLHRGEWSASCPCYFLDRMNYGPQRRSWHGSWDNMPRFSLSWYPGSYFVKRIHLWWGYVGHTLSSRWIVTRAILRTALLIIRAMLCYATAEQSCTYPIVSSYYTFVMNVTVYICLHMVSSRFLRRYLFKHLLRTHQRFTLNTA